MAPGSLSSEPGRVRPARRAERSVGALRRLLCVDILMLGPPKHFARFVASTGAALLLVALPQAAAASPRTSSLAPVVSAPRGSGAAPAGQAQLASDGSADWSQVG